MDYIRSHNTSNNVIIVCIYSPETVRFSVAYCCYQVELHSFILESFPMRINNVNLIEKAMSFK